MQNKKRVGILYGGRSVEHQISIRSARNISENINQELFQVWLIGITPEGHWYLTNEVSSEIEKGKPLSIKLNSSDKELVDADGNSIILDIVFPVLHGTDGEDGSVQGLLQVLNIPCVGSDVLGSAISMNKLVSKQLLKEAGVPVGKFVGIKKGEAYDLGNISGSLGIPCVIKPAALGSSVGVAIAKNEEQIEKLIMEAFEFDSTVIVEEFIAGREIECAILGNEKPEASLPGEIVVSDNYDFYSYDAKYMDPEAAALEIPAKIEPDLQEKVRNLCIKSYSVLNCCDYARVDLFLTESGSVFINEINTIPGFTNSSMFPKMWENMGIEYSDLITKLINLAESRSEKNQKLKRTYNSSME